MNEIMIFIDEDTLTDDEKEALNDGTEEQS